MSGYTIIDFQTTGLHPEMQDRVVEVGIVRLDRNGGRQDAWSSLVNPGRDVGRTDMHGIAARDVLDAPTFRDLAPAILQCVVGRVVVCHNPQFELQFLEHELMTSGFGLISLPMPYLATMELARERLPGAPRRLVDCCEKANIPLEQRYSSAHQAAATAALMAYFLTSDEGDLLWRKPATDPDDYPWPSATGPLATGSLKARTLGPPPREDAWLERIVGAMPSNSDPATNSYLELLERALIDQHLSEHEKEGLIGLAARLGMTRAAVDSVHREYLLAMARVALEDGLVDVAERADLDRVSALLGLTTLDVEMYLSVVAATTEPLPPISPPSRVSLSAGDVICITGATNLPRAELVGRAREHGIVVGDLTKSTKVLVAADPDSQSGKATRARRYGITIITEQALLRALNEMA